MKDVNKIKDYRVKYKRYYNLSYGKEYVVHHIDEDRSNNDIRNLVLLPAELHTRYHYLKQRVENMVIPTRITGNGINANTYLLSAMEDFMEVLKECNKWYDYKMYLDGKIPNIHNITLD